MAKKDSNSDSKSKSKSDSNSGMGSGISGTGGLGSGVDVGSISDPKEGGLGSGISVDGGFGDRGDRDRDRDSSYSSPSRSQRDREATVQAQSVFDRVADWLGFDDDEEEMDKKEEEQLVEDWYTFMSAPDDLLGQVATEEAQKMQLGNVLGGISVPGLEGKLALKGMKALATHDIEEADVDPALREAVQRNLEGQYEAEAGFGGTVADVAQAVGGFAGPLGNVIGLGAGAYKASQVPGALGRFNEQMGTTASLPEPTRVARQPRESGRSYLLPTERRYTAPQLPAVDPFAAAGLDTPDIQALLYSQNFNSLI